MQTIQIPNTTLTVSRIGHGAMGFGGTWDATPLADADLSRTREVVTAALDCGITFFDHADIYARGKSEEVFGRLLTDEPSLRDRIVIQSKCGIRFDDDPAPGDRGRYDFSFEHIVSSVEGSLRRLRTEYLDLLLLHRPDPLVEPEEVAEAFDSLHSSGKVRWFGVSNHTVSQIRLLQAYLDQQLVVNQVQLSLWHLPLIDDGIVANRAGTAHVGTEDLLDDCRLGGVLVQAYSPLGKGRSLGTPGTEGPTSDPLRAELEAIAREQEVAPAAVALAWLMRHPAGLQPIVGTTGPDRLRACCDASRVVLTREAWYRLFVAARGAPVP